MGFIAKLGYGIMINQTKVKFHRRCETSEPMGCVIETARLMLRPAALADIDTIMSGLSDFDVARMMEGASLPFLRQDALELFDNLPQGGDGGWTFALTLLDKQAVGLISLRHEKERWFLQYWLTRLYWGKGYMGEALEQIVERFFQVYPQQVLCADVYSDDVPALSLQQRLGFKITGCNEIFASIRSAMVLKIHMQLVRGAFSERAIVSQ